MNQKSAFWLKKKQQNLRLIAEAVQTLYNEGVLKVDTARTIYGKKAFVKLTSTDKARDLANKIGMM